MATNSASSARLISTTALLGSHGTTIAAVLLLVGAWIIPPYFLLFGIEWSQGAGVVKSPAPATWAVAEEWATRALWIGSTVFAFLGTVVLIVGSVRGHRSRAVNFLALMCAAEAFWALAGLTFIGVVFNALIMN